MIDSGARRLLLCVSVLVVNTRNRKSLVAEMDGNATLNTQVLVVSPDNLFSGIQVDIFSFSKPKGLDMTC